MSVEALTFDILNYSVNITPTEIKKKEVAFAFDIDGVVCEAGKWTYEANMSREDYLKYKAMANCTQEFIESISKLEDFDIYFITGRKEYCAEITMNMFKKGKIDRFIKHIYFHPDIHWTTDMYNTHKFKAIKALLQKYKRVIFTDDDDGLIEFMRKAFANDKRVEIYQYKYNSNK